MIKNLILIGGSPATGKTRFSKKLAKCINNPVYIDLDTIAPISKKVFDVINIKYDRDSEFYKYNVRDAEYQTILNMGYDCLMFNNNVILNAPFSKELRSQEFIDKLKIDLSKYNARPIIVWLTCPLDKSHERMINRNQERDKWKLENWDKYIRERDFSIPSTKGLIVVDSSNEDLLSDGLFEVIEAL